MPRPPDRRMRNHSVRQRRYVKLSGKRKSFEMRGTGESKQNGEEMVLNAENTGNYLFFTREIGGGKVVNIGV